MQGLARGFKGRIPEGIESQRCGLGRFILAVFGHQHAAIIHAHAADAFFGNEFLNDPFAQRQQHAGGEFEVFAGFRLAHHIFFRGGRKLIRRPDKP